ncbi:MAG: GNAT family N-acetyltransferase [Gemmatimonadota bacterium]|nr:MAG: GNAT family N-acetyltransferase [Gemmatimonadota bacterium]
MEIRPAPPPMQFRDYTPNDRAACIAIFDTNVGDYFVDGERQEFAEFLISPPGPYLVLETGSGEVVGCGGYALREGGKTADLCWGMIARTHHRKGLGRMLTEERLGRIEREPDVLSVVLGTSQHTTGFYEGLGFVVEANVPDGYAPGIDRCDMRLRLDRG